MNIDTADLFVSRNGSINTDITQGQGNAGDININADSITVGEQGNTFLNPSRITSEVRTGLLNNPLLEANSGNITINTNSLFVNDGGSIAVSALAIGNSGNIIINATDTLSVDGTGILFNQITQTEEQNSSDISANILRGIGDSGSIEINTANFSLTNNVRLSTSNSGEGNAGSITVNAIDAVVSDNTSINSRVFSLDDTLRMGNSGSIAINAVNLSLNNGASLTTSSVNLGDAGDINIEVSDIFIASGNSLITSNVGSPQEELAVGNVGSININAREIDFSNTAQIQAGLFTGASGDPGIISVNATESISFTGENTGIFSDNDPGSIGDASNTQISAPTILLDNGAVVQASNRGNGSGGNISIVANNLNLQSDNFINASTSSGIGGNITFEIAESIFLRNGNQISARALEDANGGNINIDTNFIVALSNGNNDIIATAELGNGGNININAEALFGIRQGRLNSLSNDISASSDFSLDGNVNINTPNVNPAQGTIDLPTNVIVPEETTQQACEANRESAAKNGLTISGKGGILPDPVLPLNSLNVTVNDEYTSAMVIPAPIETSQSKIQLARGVSVTESGEVILTAYQTENSSDRITESKRNCGQV